MGEFRTLQGYDRASDTGVTRSMEDYLEMICRHVKLAGYIRISTLAEQLHVKPSSASKMAELLKRQDLITYEKYGIVRPTKQGWKIGRYLLYRHDVVAAFLCMLNDSSDELEQVEKIEHFLDQRTVRNLDRFLRRQKDQAELQT